MFAKELSKSNRHNLILLEWEYSRISAEKPHVLAGLMRFRAHLLMQSRQLPADWCVGCRIRLLSMSPGNQRGVALSLNSTALIIAEVDTQRARHPACLSNGSSSSLIFLPQSLTGADKAFWSIAASSMWPSQTIPSQAQRITGRSGHICRCLSTGATTVLRGPRWPVQACRNRLLLLS